ncbi:MAG TPA: penicillin acylase family protein [Chitinophagaceae bacterium]
MKRLFLFAFCSFSLLAQSSSAQELARWQQQAAQVSIVRDNWGIPHVYGKTDANCVFGLLYAQCEDDFQRVEMNYIEKLGRLSEVEGATQLYNDLMIRLIIDSTDAIADYKNSPPSLHKLLDAFADGINYYLYKHPSVHPALLHHFQPWYALLWTDGSIGAISTGGATEMELKNFYTGNYAKTAWQPQPAEELPTGSNGFAIAPSKTASGHAILYINPHVTFYFRPEVQMVSEEGLNAYGAVTWGQFFVYQGFNEHCGWMHTSSQVDVSDLYAEKITKQGNGWSYLYNKEQKPVTQKKIWLFYRDGGSLRSKEFTGLYTHHGPVMAIRNGQWLTLKSFNRSMTSLIQSWQRTKATSFADFKKTLELRANTSNNTMYADAEGNIAYWHGNFVPVRDPKYDWSKPVDGTTDSTEWKGLHTTDETIHLINPPNGWLQNCNSTPFSVAGSNSPKKEDYPTYMAPDGENFRAINAVRVLSRDSAYTIDKVIHAGFDTYLAAFEPLLPVLFDACNGNLQAAPLQGPLALLKDWDLHSSESSVATTLAIYWGQVLLPKINAVKNGDTLDIVGKTQLYAATAPAADLVQAFQSAVQQLRDRYGSWQIPWGDINRYQRLTGHLQETYDDKQPSLPSGMAASTWGCLPSFVSHYVPGALKRYGYNGNSFICAVEFGKKITAKSLLAGGESGNPASPHFGDQAEMYTKGIFKDVLFYKDDVLKHAEKTYHPGE